MNNLSEEKIENLRKKYVKGSRVKLIHMDDKYAPPYGTLGTVVGVDDIGSVMIRWDNGSSLSALYGVDVIELV